MDNIVRECKELSQNLKILYVEDNQGLAKNISALFDKLSISYIYAENGAIGYDYYYKYNPNIVLTDINMSGMNGLVMAQKIKEDNNDIKVIFLSAFDEKENLHEAINIGVFRYLTKPAKVPLLITTLHQALVSIHKEQNKRIFENQLNDIFNYQNNLIMMLDDRKPIVVNRQFLDFFGVNTLDDFLADHLEMDDLLSEHKGFLYSLPDSKWFDQAMEHPGKLFHTKIINHNNQARHLIMKLKKIPQKDNYTILSFDDITDLNLMMIFDKDSTRNDQKLHDTVAIFKLMQVVKENNSDVKLHNFYKGLSIVNDAVLILIENNKIVLKTSYSQLKAIKLSKSFLISSELFPASVYCNECSIIDFDQGTATFSNIQFIEHGANQRANIRVEPDQEKHTVSVFINGIKYYGNARIIDISICSIKIALDTLPPGLEIDSSAKIVIVFERKTQPLNLVIMGTLYRIDNFPKSFHLVFLFELTSPFHDKLFDYIAMRQLELIHEFKAI